MRIVNGESLISYLKARMPHCERLLVCGVGNDLRGDDGIGLYVADRISLNGLPEKVKVLKCGEMPENYIFEIKEWSPSHILMVDAADLGKDPGTAVMVESNELYTKSISTHRLPLSLFSKIVAAELGGEVDVMMIGIQVGSCDFGAEVSDPVREAGDLVAGSVLELISSLEQE